MTYSICSEYQTSGSAWTSQLSISWKKSMVVKKVPISLAIIVQKPNNVQYYPNKIE